ncbi:hypothetical protein TYRP_006215 [Tyrophagus putrescentiae]|nr:hypothetical protein TYRP_006215 [Tyrophagus putrescentiae]
MLMASKAEKVKKEKSSEVEELRAQLKALKLELKSVTNNQLVLEENASIATLPGIEPLSVVIMCQARLTANVLTTSQYHVPPMIANVSTSDICGKCVLDSGATDHFCDGTVALENFKATSSLTVSMANGQHSYVKGCGDYYSEDLKLKLKDVKAVNSLKQGFISVNKLTNCDYKIVFDQAGADIMSG